MSCCDVLQGQTHYAHVLAHFHTDEEVTLSLEMTQEQIDAKNEKVRPLLQQHMNTCTTACCVSAMLLQCCQLKQVRCWQEALRPCHAVLSVDNPSMSCHSMRFPAELSRPSGKGFGEALQAFSFMHLPSRFACFTSVQHKGKLAAELSGPSGEVFAKALRGLSGARLTRPGQFHSADDTPAVRCSYKVGRLKRSAC